MTRKNSDDEEALRVAVEAWLKRRWPDARVVHELTLDTGANRIDVASIGETAIRAVEIKSKRDTLHRLPEQIKAASECFSEVWIALDAEKRPAFDALVGFWECGLIMHNGGGDIIAERAPRPRRPDPRRVAELLWADELRSAFGTPPRTSRTESINRAVDQFGLIEITRRVAVQLKGRPFPRADAQCGPAIHTGRFNK